MSAFDDLKLKIRRGDGPVYGAANRFAKSVMHFHVPDTAGIRLLARSAYEGVAVSREIADRVKGVLWAEPLFRARCQSVGKDFSVERVPYIKGHAKIYVGDNVTVSGALMITSGRFLDDPTLNIGNHVFLGHGCSLSVNQRIDIGDYTTIAGSVRIADSDNHPADWARRAAGDTLHEDEIQPVVIGQHVWIGATAQILKGVTIGDRSIVGAGAVVLSDVPPDSMAMGSPARIIRSKK